MIDLFDDDDCGCEDECDCHLRCGLCGELPEDCECGECEECGNRMEDCACG